MSAAQIAGCSGAGKSAVAAVLARRGLVAMVFLLEIDEPTMLARLDARRYHHDWGHIGDTREYLRHKLPDLQDHLRAAGAIPVDARQPLDQVVDAILAAIGAASAG